MVSPLTYSSVYPRPIERQNVKLALKVFCDETVAALKLQFGEKAKGTWLFIEYVVKWWLVVNVKGSFDDVRTNDCRRAPIRSSTDWQIKFLGEEIPKFASSLRKNKGTRKNKLTIDTADALSIHQ